MPYYKQSNITFQGLIIFNQEFHEIIIDTYHRYYEDTPLGE